MPASRTASSVLVLGATGVVGQVAVQAAKLLGADATGVLCEAMTRRH